MHPRIANYDFTKPKDKKAVTALLTEWMVMIGSSEKISMEENLINIKFLISQYHQMTIEEVKQAILWSITNKLDVDPNPFGKFSPLYMAKILNAYLDKRDGVINKLTWLKQKQIWDLEWQEKNKPLPYEEQLKNQRAFLIKHMVDMKANRKSDSAGSLVWKFLKRNQSVSQNMIDEDARQYAKNKYAIFQQTEFYQKSVSTLTREQIDAKTKSDCGYHERDYVIWNFLKSFNTNEEIRDFVNNANDEIVLPLK